MKNKVLNILIISAMVILPFGFVVGGPIYVYFRKNKKVKDKKEESNQS